MCSKFSSDVYNYEWSGMQRVCQEKQVFGNLLGLCLYHHMDPRNNPGSWSLSAWWLTPILLQLALPTVDERAPRVSSSCPSTLGSSLRAFLELRLPHTCLRQPWHSSTPVCTPAIFTQHLLRCVTSCSACCYCSSASCLRICHLYSCFFLVLPCSENEAAQATFFWRYYPC